MKYAENIVVSEVLPTYYQQNGFDADGGEAKDFVKLELLPKVFIYMPNNEKRKSIILLHDLHHLCTGYSNKMDGELEISAWEAASNCTSNWVAFILNVSGMFLGFCFMPRKIWRAWKLGRRTQNLYRKGKSHDELRNMTILEVKSLLGFDDTTRLETPLRLSDMLYFLWYLFVGGLINLLGIILMPLMFVYSLIIWRKIRKGTKS